MAVKFICDACGEEITDQILFVRAPHRSQLVAETHKDCFPVYFRANLNEWLNLFGLVEVGYQMLNGGSTRPLHRNGYGSL